MIIEYKGIEKEIKAPILIEMFEQVLNTGDKILINDFKAVMIEHDPWNFKPTWSRLESAFRTASYNGNYEVFELEMYCKDKQL